MPRMLDRIEQLMHGEVPPLEATERHANPMGTVHGGILADISDAAMGMAFTTMELKINFMKPVWTGKLRAEGRVLSGGRTVGFAHATSICMTLRGAAAGR